MSLRRLATWFVLCGSCVLCGTLGCQKRSPDSANAAPSASVAGASPTPTLPPGPPQPTPPPPASADPNSRPEDPVAGARSVELWREHLREEERERRAYFDRRKMKDHEAVVAFVRSSGKKFERAPNEAAVHKLESELTPALASLRERIKTIDPDENSSNLLEDYAALLKLLEGEYGPARVAALQGDKAKLDALRADFEARLKKVTDWLAYAAHAEIR